MFFFFFSSRRRHTRLTCDWSSDVCSSDLFKPERLKARGACMTRRFIRRATLSTRIKLGGKTGRGERSSHGATAITAKMSPADYAGAQACQLCHAAIYDAWRKTGMG